ncbi:SPX domain-containing protein [Pilobolus umbonatus]|nr:SPX domain-containing protein [Pilobolus umbonatus]
MKFSHSIIINAVPEWLEQYVDYDRLKKIVYRTEKDKVDDINNKSKDIAAVTEEGMHNEKIPYSMTEVSSTPTLPENSVNNDNRVFQKELNLQLLKVISFYCKKYRELMDEVRSLDNEYGTFHIPISELVTEEASVGLEKMDSVLADTRLTSIMTDDSMPSPSSTESENISILSEKKRGLDEKRKFLNAHHIDTGQSSNLPNTINSSDLVEDPDQSSTGLTFKQMPQTRRNTVDGIPATFSHKRKHSPKRALSQQYDRIGAEFNTKEDIETARQMQRDQYLLGKGRRTSFSLQQAKGIKEFNRYYNFRVRCASVYISLLELNSYVDINRSAFDKILKKWDKVTGSNLRESYFDKVLASEPFQQANMDRMEFEIGHILDMYATLFTEGNKENAKLELKMHMRDHILFERTTVWKDLVGKERETMDAHASIPLKGFNVPVIHLFISYQNLYHCLGFVISLVMYIILMCVDTMNDKEASKCLALLVFAALMWAFECIPLFATAFLIPLLVVPMHIIKDENGSVLGATVAAKQVFQSMFSDTIMVLLGGFAIAAALSKHGIAKAFASSILSKAGSRPRWVILVNMYLAVFLSMWISNVATPVLCFSLVDPILRTLRPNSTVAPCLILGIALASCIGGLASPISSPQNIIAINLLEPNPGWGTWFAVAIPCAIINVLITWCLLLIYFKPDRDTPHLNIIKSNDISMPSYSQLWVCSVCLATIALWCGEQSMNEFFGDNGVIALIPFVLLFSTNMLNKSDLNNFLWSVVVLAQGGMALGYSVESSGLLNIIGLRIAAGVRELSPLPIIFIFGLLVLVFATFVSHTVAALIILPIVKQVGEELPIPHPNLLVMSTALVCSVAMGLPVSGFPNMNAIMLEDTTGKPYLHIKNFILCGIPSSVVAGVITICLSYGILSSIGF